MSLVPTQFSINRRDIYDDAFTIGPRGITIQRDISGGLGDWHACLVAFARLIVDILQITLDLLHSLFIGDRTMTGHNGLHIHLQNAVTSSQPVARWPRPHDRMATNEEDIAREDNAIFG